MNRLNPLNDYIFKRLMEDAEHLIVFLNAVLFRAIPCIAG
jgi:hypothetical protein